jgi:hypothetical protein
MTFRHVYQLYLVLFGATILPFVYGYLCLQTPEPELVVDEPERNLSALIVDREYVIKFCLHNRGSRALRVVGAEFT